MELHEILGLKKYQIIDYNVLISKLNKKNLKYNVLTSGSKSLDEVLGGGFYTSKKYLVFGTNKTGKTQLCHQLCVQAYDLFISKLNRKSSKFIYFLDTENTFRPERIKDLSLSSNKNYREILANILVSKIMSNSAFLLTLKNLEPILKKNKGGVLIIDTINNHYNSELGNRNITFNKSKEVFIKILDLINLFTTKYNLITIATAQVSFNLAKESVIQVQPVGNPYLNHYFSEYLYLSFKEEVKSYVHLVNSIKFPEKKLLYQITAKGIQDYKY